MQRALVLARQLNPATTAGAGGLETLTLPSQQVVFNYFDAEKFERDHGPIGPENPSARPCSFIGFEPEPEAKKKLSANYRIGFEAPVMDARSVPPEAIVFDVHGFKLYKAPTTMTKPDFYNREKVMGTYMQECEELVKRATGATKVMPFDFVIRNGQTSSETGASYIFAPHNDHTLVSGPRRTRELLAEEPVNDEVMKYRFALMNVWRRWDGGNDCPLAACAYPTLDYARDMVPSDLVYEHRTGETYTVRRSERHRFYWFSDMSKDEAILLKVYDSDPQVARGSLHTGFKPPVPRNPDDPARESMEVRCIVLWGPEEITAKASLRGGQPATNVGGRSFGPAGHDNKGLYGQNREERRKATMMA